MMKFSPLSMNTPSVTLLLFNLDGFNGDPFSPLGVNIRHLGASCFLRHTPSSPVRSQLSAGPSQAISLSDSSSLISMIPPMFPGLMTLCSVRSLASFTPGTLLGLQFCSPSSLTTSSACRGSASSSTPDSVSRTTLLRILTSLTSFSANPNVSVLILYFSRRAASVDANWVGSPTATKSSPCTMMETFLVLWWKRHGDVRP